MQIKKPDGKLFIPAACVKSAGVFEMLVQLHTHCHIHTTSACGYGYVLHFIHLILHFDLLLKSWRLVQAAPAPRQLMTSQISGEICPQHSFSEDAEMLQDLKASPGSLPEL